MFLKLPYNHSGEQRALQYKALGNSVQEFGGNCRRSALSAGNRVIDDFIRQTRKL